MKPALYPIFFLAVAVFLLIRSEILEQRRRVYVFKPIATLTVILIAALSFLEPAYHPIYTIGVLIGLLFSLGGDVALMFHGSRKAFAVGLGLFLVAHVAYTLVFLRLGRFSAWDLLWAVVLGAVAVGFYTLIRSNLGAMRAPVIGYIAVITLMVSRSISTLASPTFSTAQGVMIVAGAVLFYISDAILALNRFGRPWRYHRISLAFYYSGQMLLALAASYFV
ncbi:MAG: lysoplasmalogenase [Anaerolineae bacterium]|nr:lysoplasmalogenase [Anaerolineae bacterium]